MLVVDTSVLIDFLKNVTYRQTHYLTTVLGVERVLLGDLVLMELLQGARDDAHAIRIAAILGALKHVNMVEDGMAVEAAKHSRTLRTAGVTLRSQIDLLIGTYCIRHSHALLHSDRDFDAMARHLKLPLAVEPDHIH